MKKYILLLLMLVSLQLWAQYSTPGNNGSYTLEDLVDISGGAVTFDMDHYFFNQDIIISATDTLNIINNEYLQIGENLLWTIEGVLIIEAPDMSFISNISGGGKFLGLRFDNSSASLVKNASFVNAGGIKLIESDVEFDNCSFGNFDIEYSTGAINIFQSNPIIINSSFTNNEGPAISSGANSASSPTIINNLITSNVTGNANTPQINLGTYDGSNPIVIDSNQISGEFDNAGGIALSTLTGGNIEAFVRYNEVINNRYGIAMIGSNITGEISYNYLDGNNIQNDPMLGGSGLNFYGGESNQLMVHHNIITNNLWGITIQLNAQPNFGDALGSSPGHNQIFDNGNSGETYALYNNTAGDILALNNFWGTETLEQTEDVIFHQADDLSLGEVFYDPIWMPVGVEEVQQEQMAIYPNPAPDYFIWNGEAGDLHILDMRGKVLWEGWVEQGEKVDMDLNTGVYFLQSGDQNIKLIVH